MAVVYKKRGLSEHTCMVWFGVVCFKADQSARDLFYHVGLNAKKSHFEDCHAPL